MRLLLALPTVLCLLLAAGVLYQYAGGLRDRLRFIRQGRRVKIAAGDWMYLCERGSDGPAIIFEAGIGATSQNWHGLQQELARVARTVSYDRIGLGWSSTARCTVRTPSNIARELHEMLQAARIAPPYLMVGHSFGGLVVRRFAAQYPHDVSGVVLVDPMRPEEWPPLNEAARPLLNRGIRILNIGASLAWIGLARLIATSMLCRSGRIARAVSRSAGRGGAHLLGRLTSELGKMPRTVWPVVAAHWSNPHFYRGMVAHLQAVPASVREMQNAAPIDGTPVTLLTPHSSSPLSPLALSRIGVHTRQIVARSSGHWIHLDEPELVRGAIQAMMEESGLSSSWPRYLYSGLAAADAVDDPEGVSDGAPAETGFAAGV